MSSLPSPIGLLTPTNAALFTHRPRKAPASLEALRMQITESAAQRLRTSVLEEIDEAGKCYRIAMSEEAVDLVIDEHREDDIAFEYEGTLVLVLDVIAAEAVGDLILDYDDEKSELLFCKEEDYESIEEIDSSETDKEK
jgi:Fe-S cluster assembly iron-binding protein IscA